MEIDPLWVSVSATVVLVVINIYYAWQTRQMVKEMVKARKTEFLPRLKATLPFLGPTRLALRVQNIGKGPAIDADALIKMSPSEEEPRKWQQPLVAPGESETFFLPTSNFKELAEKFDYVIVEGSFKDIFGDGHKIDERLNIKELLKNVETLKMMWREPVERTIKRIEEHLRDITKVLKDLRDITKFSKET